MVAGSLSIVKVRTKALDGPRPQTDQGPRRTKNLDGPTPPITFNGAPVSKGRNTDHTLNTCMSKVWSLFRPDWTPV